MDSYKAELEVQKSAFKSELDLTMQSIDNDLSTYCDINLGENLLFSESSSNFSTQQQQPTSAAQLKKLLYEIEDKNVVIKNLKKNEEFYITEINNLQNRLNDILEESANYKHSTTENKSMAVSANDVDAMLDGSTKEDLINLDTSISSSASTTKSESESECESSNTSSSSSSQTSSASSSTTSDSASTTTQTGLDRVEPNPNISTHSNPNYSEVIKSKEFDDDLEKVDDNNEDEEAVDKTIEELLDTSRVSETTKKVDHASSLKKLLDEKDLLIEELNGELQKLRGTSHLTANEHEDYKSKYLALKESMDTMTCPAFVDMQSELQRHFYAEYAKLKSTYEAKFRHEVDDYRQMQEEKIRLILEENNVSVFSCCCVFCLILLYENLFFLPVEETLN